MVQKNKFNNKKKNCNLNVTSSSLDKDNKGNWEFNFFQKKEDLVLESKIKVLLRFNSSFDPRLIKQYMNENICKEEQLLMKKNKGEKLKTSENIIIENYTNKFKEMIKTDIANIENYGLTAKPITQEGKLRLLLYTLDYQIKHNNYDLVCYIYLRLLNKEFELTNSIKEEFATQIELMNNIVLTMDLIELQFVKLYSQMPPLNFKGFKQLDLWQKKVINNIDNNISTLIYAPTSSGKSILSGYTLTKGRILFVVPTDALAWQISSYLETITNSHVPIITATYQSSPNKDNLINLLNSAQAIAGTADIITDWLPFLKNNFNWIIFDEIHMIGNPEGSSMEYIIKLLPNIPFLALSATISNSTELLKWFKECTNQNIDQIIYTKKFFNLRKFYYDNNSNELKPINPLILLDKETIINSNIRELNLDPTPPDIWILAKKLMKDYDLKNINPYKYFSNKQIELNETIEYFTKLLEFIKEKYQGDNQILDKIFYNLESELNNAETDELKETDIKDLINLAFKLKEEKKTPAIVFQIKTDICLNTLRNFAKEIERMEYEIFPSLYTERQKINKIIEKMNKKKNEETDYNSKKLLKQLLAEDEPLISKDYSNLQEPTEKFIFNYTQYFNEDIVKDWVKILSVYFPNTGYEYHYMIKLLWRGVGIYTKGLPDPYLRIVQTLAMQKQLAIVFSDKSLIFGVNMPFRSVILLKEESEELPNAMLFNQMCGRAGRRGLDKEGNIIFVGYKWKEIKKLCTNKLPYIQGNCDMPYTVIHGIRISELNNINLKWDNIYKNCLNTYYNNEELIKEIKTVEQKYNTEWKNGFDKDNINHLLLNWRLRYNKEGLIVSYLFPYIRLAFENKDPTIEINQINLANMLCNFFNIEEIFEPENSLISLSILNNSPFDKIFIDLESIDIFLPKYINNDLFLTIQNNKISNTFSIHTINTLRDKLLNFSNILKTIQHYCFHSKISSLTKLFGKLLTRLWWIYHTSSPILKSLN